LKVQNLMMVYFIKSCLDYFVFFGCNPRHSNIWTSWCEITPFQYLLKPLRLKFSVSCFKITRWYPRVAARIFFKQNFKVQCESRNIKNDYMTTFFCKQHYTFKHDNFVESESFYIIDLTILYYGNLWHATHKDMILTTENRSKT
jgi:hypothetical protein